MAGTGPALLGAASAYLLDALKSGRRGRHTKTDGYRRREGYEGCMFQPRRLDIQAWP